MADTPTDARILEAIDALVRTRLAEGGARPFVLGLCGAQGSGKSTVAAALADRWTSEGLTTAILSLDDLYKTKADRLAMAEAVHPLFATRGPPGTHAVARGIEVIAELRRGQATGLPRFDKAIDNRSPRDLWPNASGDTQILIFEGWCVGARPEAEVDLVQPINALEREEDREGTWRRTANRALADDYLRLFALIDSLILLAAPGFAIVQQWRTQQEQALRSKGAGSMADAQIARFIQHYERLTRHILATMPDYADLTIRLDEARRPLSIARP